MSKKHTKKPKKEITICIIDRIPLKEHLKCINCGILLGPKHLTFEVNNTGSCLSCTYDVKSN